MSAPTTAEINANIIAQLEANLNQSIPLLPRAFNRVISKALAAVFIILYKYAGYNALQQFVKYASYGDTTINGVTFSPLIEWGRLIGVGDPIAATYAEFDVVLPVTLNTGTATINEGTLFRAAENGYAYAATASTLIDANDSAVNVRVKATTQPGSAGNVTEGSAVVLAQPTAGVDPNGTRGTERVTGQDAEAEAEYRRRVVLRFRQRPQGGSLVDYRTWGEEAGNVVCYPYRSDKVEGQVETYVRSTTAEDGAPTQAQIQAVLDYQYSSTGAGGVNDRQPVGAHTTATAALRRDYTVFVSGLSGASDDAQAREGMRVAIEGYFEGRAPYVLGLDTGARTDIVSYFSVVGTAQAVADQYGATFSSVSLFRTGGATPVSTETLPRGTFATAGVTVS